MTCSNPISPSLNSSSNSSSSSSPTISQSSHHHQKETNPATFKTRTNLLRNNSNRSHHHHHRSFSQGTVPLSPSNNSIIKSPTSSSTTTTTFNEPTSSYLYVQPASPLHEPINKSNHSNLENLSSSNSNQVDPSINHLTVRSRRARLPSFTPLIQPEPISFPRRRSLPKSLSNPTTNTITHLVRVHDYAHSSSNQPIHYISTSNPTLSLSSPPPLQDLNSSSPIKRPLHQKAKSETGSSNGMRIELGHHHSNSLLAIDETQLELGTPMLRKKSGEVVRSSLKETRAKSAPATPTGPKYVHFDSHLEHVKHFLSQQRPTAVSRDGSPIETETEGEEEFPFPITINQTKLILELNNFPLNPDLIASQSNSKVWLRWIELTNEGKTLKGEVQVKNLSFQKLIAIRFTFDSWQTVSEVMAEYKESIKFGEFDRFTFSIKLLDQLTRIEERKMLMAIRYTTNGKEIWDNNLGMNYDIRFKKVRSLGGSGITNVGIHQKPFKPINDPVIYHHPSPDLSSTTMIPNISNDTSPIKTESFQSTTTTPYQWSVTTEIQAKDRMEELRAELDRLVGDDLGLSIPSQLNFKTSSSSSNSIQALENSKLESNHQIKKFDSISATNQLKLNSLNSQFGSRYDFSSSLKQAVISPRFEERKSSFGSSGNHSSLGVGIGFSQRSSPNFDSSTTSNSISTITDSTPRSELIFKPSNEIELNFNQIGNKSFGSGSLDSGSVGNGLIGNGFNGNGSNGNVINGNVTNGQTILNSLRTFQEQKLKGGHNLEVSDYGDLVQNFCWGGATDELNQNNNFYNSRNCDLIPNGFGFGLGIHQSSIGVESVLGSEIVGSEIVGSEIGAPGVGVGVGVESSSSNNNREEIEILLESVKVKFGSSSSNHQNQTQENQIQENQKNQNLENQNQNQKTIGLGITDGNEI